MELLRGLDPDKDQSYFLASVKGQALRDVLFPVGLLSKERVRRMAQEAGLHVAERRSTAGICFIGKCLPPFPCPPFFPFFIGRS